MDEARIDVGRLYDAKVADTYDQDAWGLLAGGRALAMQQIERCGLAEDCAVLDLGVGTGESLCTLAKMFPRCRRIGVDLSARMIARAQEKISFEAHVDDACNADAHVASGSLDLVLAHFLTTFVDRAKLFAVARKVLRSGGLLSIVSTPGEAFAKVNGYANAMVGEEVMADANPAPKSVESLAEEVRAAGLEVRQIERFRRPIVFETVDQTLEWGTKSGFFAHTFEALGAERLAQLRPMVESAGIFPIEDEYVAAVILASPRS